MVLYQERRNTTWLLYAHTEEVQTVRTECGYTPSVLEWSEDDITLVYAEGYSGDDIKGNYNSEDCAYYRIFEVEI